MGFPQARMTDVHLCPVIPPPLAPAVAPFPIMPPCAVNVLVGSLPAARMGLDLALGTMGVPHPFVFGSMTVLINGLPALRIKDPCALGGMITVGEFTVLTGG